VTVYGLVAARACTMGASLERAAMLVSLAEDLSSGQAACFAWQPGQREAVLSLLVEPLRRPDWSATVAAATGSAHPLDGWRATWIQQAAKFVVTRPSEPVAGKDYSGIEVRIVVADPATRDEVSTRILVDGNPVIASAFDKGPAFPPEALLAGNRLHATSDPHEVRLAEAYCTEGCCGALYVTIVRDGDTVLARLARPYQYSSAS